MISAAIPEGAGPPAASPPPQVSVIIPCYHSWDSLPACLRSLAAQTTLEPFEVIVVESTGDDTPARIQAGFPGVKVVACAERRYCGDARNLGIAVAQGEVIAFLDADCTAGSRWIAEVLAAHRASHPLVSGAVTNGSRQSAIGWAYYFVEFSQWLPQRRGPLRDIAGCCMSMDRALFRRHGPFIEGTYCSDTVFQWQLRRNGIIPHWSPDMLVEHHVGRLGLRAYLAHAVEHGRSFAAVRIRAGGATGARRLACAAASPLLPGLLFGRILARVLRSGRCLPSFVRATPFVLLGVAAWSWGELWGYLTGRGPRRSTR